MKNVKGLEKLNKTERGLEDVGFSFIYFINVCALEKEQNINNL